MTRRLWIRTEGSPTIGLGHVMRCIAIAERSREDFRPVRFAVGETEHVAALVRARGFEAVPVADPQDRAWLAQVDGEDAVVFDGYRFDTALIAEASHRAGRTAVIDDLGRGAFPVDVLLNQNPMSQTRYAVPDTAVLLLGPRFALVRGEFLQHRRYRGDDAARTLLVTAGGSDVAGLSQLVLERAVHRPSFERLVVVMGPAAAHHARPDQADVEVVVAPADVAATFARGDAAIAAAGTTTWELLAMGIPTALVQVAANQAAVGPGVAAEGAALFLGDAASLDARLEDTMAQLADAAVRRDLSRAALELVDGKGSTRFLSALLG